MTFTVISEPSGDTPGTVSVKMAHYIPKPNSTLTIPNEITKDGKRYVVTKIDESGFTSLDGHYDSVVLPDNLKIIGSSAFKGTTIKSITLNNKLEEIQSSAFRDCENLTAIVIPGSVKSINKDVFLNCTSLSSVNLSEGITFLGASAFDGCERLESLFVPDSLTDSFSENNWSRFHSGSYLKEITISSNNGNYVSVDGIVYTKDGTKLIYCPPAKTNAIVKEGVTQIGLTRGQVDSVSLGFAYCRELQSVTLPSSLERIEEEAFYMCGKLENISISDSVTYIGAEAFYACKSLAHVKLPTDLGSIKSGTFSQCYSLNNVHLPYGLESIEKYAFLNCTALERIEIPSTVKSIGEGTFKSCTELQGVDLPDQLKTIESDMFSGCKSLRTFVVPNDVTTIKGGVFSGCWSLVSIEFPTTITTVYADAFGDGSHRFFNKDCVGDSDYYKPGGDVEKIQGRTYIGSVYSNEFTFHEYTGSESDVRYNIRYYTNGGYNDFANPPDMTRDDEITLAEPTRKGHTFNGWYTDPELTTKIGIIEKGQSKNIRLYAKWTPEGGSAGEHKVIIRLVDPNGNTLYTEEHSVAENIDYSYSISFPYGGYDPESKRVTGTMGTSDVEIEIKLIPKDFTITLKTGKPISTIPGWTSAGDNDFESTFKYGSAITLPALNYQGRDCKWSCGTDYTTMPDIDLEYVAEWEYILTLNFGDELDVQPIDDWKKVNGQLIKGFFRGEKIDYPAVTDNRYDISWPTDAPGVMPVEDYTVNAIVTAKSFEVTITFEDDAPSLINGWEGKEGTFVRSFEYGSQLELPESDNPELKIVWSPEPPVTMPAENLKFTGKWETATYEITIMIEKSFPSEIDGWKHNGRGVYSKVFEYGSGISLPQGDIPGFISWGDGVVIPETMPAHDLSFTAVQKNLYHIALPSGTGYTIEAMPGYDPSTVWAGDKFEFRIVLNPSYNKSSPVIKVGDMVLEPVDGVYTIADVGSDLAVTVSGIKANPSSGGGSGGSSTPTTPSKPDVKVDEDGTKTTTEKGSDGSVTETVEKTDGSTTVTKTEKDGSKTETTTSADGSKKESTLTKTDTGTIETEKNFDSEGKEIGSVEKKTETIEHDSGTMSSETIKTKDSEGKETVKKKLESSDGSLSISIDASIEDGKVSLKTEISIDIAPGTDVSDAISDAIDRMASGIKDDVTDGDAEASHSMKIITKDETATISADSFAKISDLGMKASFDMGAGTVEFDSDISKKLSESKGPVGISMVRAAMDALSDAKRASVGDRPAFEITAESDGESIHELGGTARITLAYELPAGVSASDVRAFYVDDDGIKHMMDTVFDALTGKLSFTTPHFSLYVIGTVADADVSSEDDRTTIYVCAAVIVAAVAAVAAFVLCRKS